MKKPKNVMFIIIDQLRADCLFGRLASFVDTPNLDALMNESVTFRNHYSVVNPCGPSRASILTGQYSMNHRSIRNGTPLRHNIPTLPGELRRAGHVPLLYGYTDTSQDPAGRSPDDPALSSYEYPMADFDEIVEMRMETSHPWRADLKAKGYDFDYYFELLCHKKVAGRPARLGDPAPYRAEDSDTAFLTDACIADLATRKGKGWFAHLTYIRPHPPLIAPEPYNSMYEPAELPLPERPNTVADEIALHPFFRPVVETQTAGSMVPGFSSLEPTDANVQQLRATYFGLATEVDHHIGRVVAHLKDTGEYNETLIIVTADHGEMLGDHHAWGKMNIHNAAYHTPLIVRTPYSTGGGTKVVTAFTESVDIAPTILDLLGITVPPSMDGLSLRPMLEGGVPDGWRDCCVSELDFADVFVTTPWQTALGTNLETSNLSIIRDYRFSLVHFSNSSLPPILFDHDKNGSTENVAQKPEYGADLLELTQRLLSHRLRNADQTLATSQITAKGLIAGSRRS